MAKLLKDLIHSKNKFSTNYKKNRELININGSIDKLLILIF